MAAKASLKLSDIPTWLSVERTGGHLKFKERQFLILNETIVTVEDYSDSRRLRLF